jgi:hypothetical protein
MSAAVIPAAVVAATIAAWQGWKGGFTRARNPRVAEILAGVWSCYLLVMAVAASVDSHADPLFVWDFAWFGALVAALYVYRLQPHARPPMPRRGWYPDPFAPDRVRWWTGNKWSTRTRGY